MNEVIKALGRQAAIVVVMALMVVVGCATVYAAEGPGGAQQLLAKYPALKAKLEKNQFGAPIYLDSTEGDGTVRVDMYGVFYDPFDVVRDAVQKPSNWCDITFLHQNTKACTSKKVGDQWYVTLYSGRKYYQPPSDAYPLKLKFQVLSQQPNYIDIALTAEEGPFKTRDHRMGLEAVPLDARKSFLHFTYSYKFGSMARLAEKGYFSTIGRDKVGFSVVKKDGKPVYVDGARGAIERNTVRYYLALETFVDTMSLPPGQRFEQRLSRWYDLTAKYPKQLKELDKSEYLAEKRREYANQVALQKKEAKADDGVRTADAVVGRKIPYGVSRIPVIRKKMHILPAQCRRTDLRDLIG